MKFDEWKTHVKRAFLHTGHEIATFLPALNDTLVHRSLFVHEDVFYPTQYTYARQLKDHQLQKAIRSVGTLLECGRVQQEDTEWLLDNLYAEVERRVG